MPGNSLKPTMDEMAKIMTNTPVILPNTETSALQTCVRAPCNDESYTCVFPCNMLPLIDGKVVPFCMCMYLLHYNITWFLVNVTVVLFWNETVCRCPLICLR